MLDNLTNRVNGLKIANPLRTLDFIEDVNIDGGTIDDYGVALEQVVGKSNGQEDLIFLPLAKKLNTLYSLRGVNLSLTRAVTKVYTDKDGNAQTAPIDAPVYDWTNGQPELVIDTDIVTLPNGYSQATLSRLGNTDVVVASPTGYNLPNDRYIKIVMTL